MRWRVLFVGLFVPMATARMGAAQLVPARLVAANVLLSVTSAADSGGENEIVLPAVLATGAPRSYQVVSVPLPDRFRQASGIDVEIVTHGQFVVLGNHRRTIKQAGDHGSKLSLTIGVPATALAGHSIAAEARFYLPGSPTVIIPIEIDVNLVRRIVLRTATAPLHAQAGSDMIVSFEIANSGNADESIQPALVLPDGWSSRDLPAKRVVVAPGETVKRKLRLYIPPLASTGASFVRIDLRQGVDTVASAMTTVEVLNSSSIGSYAGPVIVSALSRASDENGIPSSVWTLSATGPLYDSVRVNARVSHGSPLTGASSSVFARLGTFQSSASVVLSAPSGEVSLGNAGSSFSELTGVYPYGEGMLVRIGRPGWAFTALGARSIAEPGTGSQRPMVGVHAERRLREVLVGTSISHLAEGSSSPRRLDALGVSAAVPTLFGSTLKAEIAERRFAGGSGLGWSGELVRTNAESNEQLRVTRAPGGSDAFARAAREIVANVSEPLIGPVNISASAWRTSDVSSVFSGLRSSGFSVRPEYKLRTSTSVAVEVRSYLFDARSRSVAGGNGGGFGNRENQLGISLSSYFRQYYFNSSAYLGNVLRTVSPVGQPATSDRLPRNYWTNNAGWSGAAGGFELHTRIEQTRDHGGFVTQQSIVGVRGDQLVLPWLGGIRAEGDLQRVVGFGSEKSSIVRAGVAIPIMNGFSLKLDAERNSIFRSATGRAPWILGARFEHTLIVPMIRRPGTAGYVYQDLNGNQRRDPGEPGVAGAVVRRGGESAVADERGKYRVAGDPSQSIVIDEASLPDGWSPAGVHRTDLAVSLSTSADVELVVAARPEFSASDMDLSKAHVIAKDSSGREWGAKMTGPTTATFDALPVGSYMLEFDLSEVSEPLVPRGPIPRLVVTGKESRSVMVTLDPRPVRMWTPAGTHGTGTKGASTPERSVTPNLTPGQS